MVLDSSIGVNLRRYLQAGESIVVINGRSYRYTGSPGTGVQRGNTMAQKLGTNWAVPTGKVFTAYVAKAEWSQDAVNSGERNRLQESAILPIGQGTDPTNTASYTTAAHVDMVPTNFSTQLSDAGGNWMFCSQVLEDCEIEFSAGQYPKVGTLGRVGAPDPGQILSNVSVDLQLIGVLADA